VCVPKLMVAVAWGGMVVAVAQLELVPHAYVGRLALEWVGVTNLSAIALSNAQAFEATLYMAAILLAVAAILGGLMGLGPRDITGALDRDLQDFGREAVPAFCLGR